MLNHPFYESRGFKNGGSVPRILLESGGKGSPIRDHTESSCIDFSVVDRRHYGRLKSKSLSDCHISDLIGHSH